MSEQESSDDSQLVPRSSNPPVWSAERNKVVLRYWTDASMAFQEAAFFLKELRHPYSELKPDRSQRWRSIMLGYALVAVWSALEALVRDSLIDWLVYMPEAWHVKRVTDLKITLGDWIDKDINTQAEWVITELWKLPGKADKNPITRFETLFEIFGIPKFKEDSDTLELQSSGADYDDVPRLLTELWAIRNIIIHQLGIVDAAFCSIYPHFSLAEGQDLIITPEEFNRYHEAATIYMLRIIRRLARAYTNQGNSNT